MKTTTYILPFLLLSLFLGAGCGSSKTETQLIGIWEVYDSTEPEAIGLRINFYEGNIARFIAYGGLSVVQLQYKVEGGILQLFKMRDENFKNPIESAKIKIKHNKLSIKGDEGALLQKTKCRQVEDLLYSLAC